jgi:hypothetical protein
MKTIILFNPTDQIGSTELIALNSYGLEVGRIYGDLLLPRQTLELVAGRLLSTVSSDDVSSLVVLSSVTLIGRQRVDLPHGESMTIPGFTSGEGTSSASSATELKKSATLLLNKQPI